MELRMNIRTTYHCIQLCIVFLFLSYRNATTTAVGHTSAFNNNEFSSPSSSSHHLMDTPPPTAAVAAEGNPGIANPTGNSRISLERLF